MLNFSFFWMNEAFPAPKSLFFFIDFLEDFYMGFKFMAITASGRSSIPVWKRLGGGNPGNKPVCKYWKAGRCNKNPCKFLHSESALPQPMQSHDDLRFYLSNLARKCGGKIGHVTQQELVKTQKVARGGIVEKNDEKLLKTGHPGSGNKNAQSTYEKLLKSKVAGIRNKNIQSSCENLPKSEIVETRNNGIQHSDEKFLKSGVAESWNEDMQKGNQKLPKNEMTESRDKSTENSLEKVPKSKVAERMNECIQKSNEKLPKSEVAESANESIEKSNEKLPKSEVAESTSESIPKEWFCGNGLAMLAKLEGHNKAVTGIALPSGSDKLYTGSQDKSMRCWDCQSGQCTGVFDMDNECGTVISDGPWMFIGLPNVVKASNIQIQSEFTLHGLLGQINAIATSDDILFVGTENGTIYAWKFTSVTSAPELVATLKGHSDAVLSLVVGAKRLYSGSADHSIRMWDIESLQWMQTLSGHKDNVTSVLCWDSFLLSGSLDKKIKVWAQTDNGRVEEVHESEADDGILAFGGLYKDILICSLKDGTVRLYDLPQFTERGRIFAKAEIRVIQRGPDGLFFTGDADGSTCVWKLQRESSLTT